VSPWPEPLARAYAACESLARSHYENFPVASRLLPAPMRPHVAAVYAFARIADDFADEGVATVEERQARLRDWQMRLHQAVAASDVPPVPPRTDPKSPSRVPDAPNKSDALDAHDLMFVAIGHTIRSCHLPVALFDDLLSAFGQDTMTTRYDSWCDLLDYCRRSANPVGRLVLRIAGRASDDLDRSSDALCTALQLTNFWQDFGRDWRAGRLYVPREISAACGAIENDLGGPRLTPAWAQTISACVEYTRGLFTQGRPVCDGVPGRLRYELRLTWLGGVRILDRVDRGRFGLLDVRPALGAGDVAPLVWQAAVWRTSNGASTSHGPRGATA
jgi:hydroxysqualene synthase